MHDNNVQSLKGVTLVGPGAPRRQDIAQSLVLAPTLVAADGGARDCLEAGHHPVAVIGDFDSLDHATEARLGGARMIRIADMAEQDSTDFEKCLTRIDAPFIVATGFTAGRVDHAMAVWSVLARRIGPPTVVLGPEDAIFAAPPLLHLDLLPGTRVSLFPMAPLTGTSRGLEWPIDGLTLSPLGRIGTSNRSTGPVSLKFDSPGCLVITPREVLATVLASLTGSPPARAL